MPLPHGCTSAAEQAFAAKHGIVILNNPSLKTVALTKGNSYVSLLAVSGDCTGASLYSASCSGGYMIHDAFGEFLPIIQEYLSLNARINCFATRMCHTRESAHALIKILAKHNVKNISVNIGNRDNNQEHIQVSFNVKVPAPIIRNYNSAETNHVAAQHNHMDFTEYNALQKEFGLYIKSGKGL